MNTTKCGPKAFMEITTNLSIHHDKNYKHMKMLEEIFGLGREKFESIIVFTEHGELKTEMPDNVIYSTELVKLVRSHKILKIDYDVLDLPANKLEEYMLDNSRENIRRHRKHVRIIKSRR